MKTQYIVLRGSNRDQLMDTPYELTKKNQIGAICAYII